MKTKGTHSLSPLIEYHLPKQTTTKCMKEQRNQFTVYIRETEEVFQCEMKENSVSSTVMWELHTCSLINQDSILHKFCFTAQCACNTIFVYLKFVQWFPVLWGELLQSYYGSGFYGIVNFICLEHVFIHNVKVIKTDLSLTKT